MSRARSARRGEGGRKWKVVGSGAWVRGALWLLAWAAGVFPLLGYNLFPGRVSLRLGERSPSLVRAPRTAQYVDLEETERLRREAERRASLSPQYSPLAYALPDAEQRFETAFEELKQAAQRPAGDGGLPAGLSAEAGAWVRTASPEELAKLRQHGVEILHQVMSKEIRDDTADVVAARAEVETLARRRPASPAAGQVLAALASREVRANRRHDPEATAAARAEAAARVQQVTRTIQADQVIVLPGERVTRQHLAMLRALGLSSPRLDYRRTLAIALIVGLMVTLLGAQTRHWARRVYDSPKLLLLLALVFAVALFAISLLSVALPNVWMLVVPTAALMAAVLLGDEVGLAMALALSLVVGLMANGGLMATLVSLGSAGVGLSYVSHLWPVSRLRWIVGVMAGANLVLAAATGLLQGQPWSDLLREGGLAVLYSPGAAALSLGGIFLLQRPFGITTHLGLLELSNPQQPLLRRLQAEAPGTYYASTLVADLADGAAEAVGANALLARVGALYHDIGKLERPSFFVENQGMLGLENVHDRLSSSLSGLIIMSHVKDGLELARRHRLPSELAQIVEQHHGTTLVKYFYQRALSGDRPESVTEDHFRYPGPLPKTKEAALVMLADSVQAATKSIADPTPQRVQQMVRDIVRDRVVDGQLAESDLTFREIAAAEATMTRMLSALLCHTRIEYPEAVPTGPRA